MIAPPSPSLRVVLVARDDPTCAALRERIDRAGIVVCGTAADPAGAVAAVARERPDVCLVHAVAPLDALAVTAAVCDGGAGVRVVLVGPNLDDEALLHVVVAGASGYLAADTPESRLVAALSDVAAGLPAFPRRLGVLLIGDLPRELRRAD